MNGDWHNCFDHDVDYREPDGCPVCELSAEVAALAGYFVGEIGDVVVEAGEMALDDAGGALGGVAQDHGALQADAAEELVVALDGSEDFGVADEGDALQHADGADDEGEVGRDLEGELEGDLRREGGNR